MRKFAVHIPAFVSVKFEARDVRHALKIIERLEGVSHDFGPRDQRLTEFPQVKISADISLHPKGAEGRAFED